MSVHVVAALALARARVVLAEAEEAQVVCLRGDGVGAAVGVTYKVIAALVVLNTRVDHARSEQTARRWRRRAYL